MAQQEITIFCRSDRQVGSRSMSYETALPGRLKLSLVRQLCADDERVLSRPPAVLHPARPRSEHALRMSSNHNGRNQPPACTAKWSTRYHQR
jgi:hypothetical protein